MKNTSLWLLLSRIALVINNLVPIFGVIFLKWNLFNLILIFWLESGVIGVFYLIKLLKDKGLARLKECMIFTVAIGAFMFGHYIFILIGAAITSYLRHGSLRYGLFSPVWQNPSVLYALISMIISHGAAFHQSMKDRKSPETSPDDLREENIINRILIMQATILGAAVLMAAFRLNKPIIALIILILLKTALDLKAQRNELTKGRKISN